LKLLHILVKENVLRTNHFDYAIFRDMYFTPPIYKTKEHYALLTKILSRIKKSDTCPFKLVRLDGDEFGDRGEDDKTTAILLIRISELIPLNILGSNHGLLMMLMVRNKFKGLLYGNMPPQFIKSMLQLNTLFKQRTITKKALLAEFKQLYHSNMQLICYSETSTTFTIHSHGRIGTNTIKSAALLFEVPFLEKKMQPAEIIDCINQRFRKEILSGSLFKRGLGFNTQVDVLRPPLEFPILRCMWSRFYDSFDEPLTSLKEAFPWIREDKKLFFVHAHTGQGFVEQKYEDRVFNLDNELGKGHGHMVGKYIALLTQSD